MTGMLVVSFNQGCKLQVLVPLRVFGMESHYICSFRYCLGLCIKKFTKNAVMSVFVWFPLGVSLSLSHTHIGIPQGFNFHFPIASPSLLMWEYPRIHTWGDGGGGDRTQVWNSLIVNDLINAPSLGKTSLKAALADDLYQEGLIKN